MELAIKLYEGQGLGNQIFTITSLYKLSLLTDRTPKIFDYQNYKGKSFLDLNKEIFIFGKKKELNTFYEIKDIIQQELISGLDKTNHKDFIYELFSSDCSKIVLKGNLQNEFFLPQKEELFKIFPILKSIKKHNKESEKKILIHVRGGDYKKTLARPTRNFYYRSLNFLKSKYPISIICDDREFTEKLLPNFSIISKKESDLSDIDKAPHHLGFSIQNDFNLLINSKLAIIPASSFSYWARIFSHIIYNDSITVAPLNWYGYRLGNFFNSPLNYKYNDFVYINKKGSIFNSNEIEKNKRNKNQFLIKKVSIKPKIRILINLLLINIFRK